MPARRPSGDGGTEVRIELTEVDGHCWHAYLPDVRPGQRYGYRVHGPWDPANGLWCNPAKLLLDPYAKAIDGEVDWDDGVLRLRLRRPRRAEHRPTARRTCPAASSATRSSTGATTARPSTGCTRRSSTRPTSRASRSRHPGVPEELRGTYSALAHPAVVDHLTDLGVTAIELMPVHQFVHDHHLVERGLRNYWGYNSIAYLAPHNGYTSPAAPRAAVNDGQPQSQVQEFKTMVKALHAAGIEVILDVVYNHTAEGNHLGPMLSMRGIDNHAYYRLMDDDPRHYLDFTGTGNSLNMRHPHVLQLIMDSLRYWVTEMHVDGFRFDLASTLARELYAVDRLSAFFDLVQQDPVVSPGQADRRAVGRRRGRLPGRQLPAAVVGVERPLPRHDPRLLARRAGDAGRVRLPLHRQLRPLPGRHPTADGIDQLRHRPRRLHAADLVSYNDKHNEANGEDNRDGESHNRSWNCGVEGPTDDPDVLALRARQRRNLLTTLLLSQGVPMLLGGDELGRTQGGNNNAYCQDNEISWFDWDDVDKDFLEWCQTVATLRRHHPVFRRRRWFQGRRIRDIEDLAWFRPDGETMTDDDWENGYARAVGVFLNGDAIPTTDAYGGRIVDDSFFVMFNASETGLPWTVPGGKWARDWEVELDTDLAHEPGTEVAARIHRRAGRPVDARPARRGRPDVT